ncbi:hypothetical protein CsSME_00052991 [Camellia sinensis var. sinensis]
MEVPMELRMPNVTWITGSLLFVMMGNALLMAISLTEGKGYEPWKINSKAWKTKEEKTRGKNLTCFLLFVGEENVERKLRE